MKNEVLRFNNVSAVFSEAERLDNINFSIHEKELIGLIGLKGAGVMRIVNLLEGRGKVSAGSISFQQKPYYPRGILDANGSKIFVVRRNSSLLLDFSIAENLFLLRGSVRSFSIYSRKVANKEAKRALNEFGIDLLPETLCSDLSRFEKMIIELVKISIQRPRVIILYDFLTDFSPEMSKLLRNIFQTLVARGVSIILAINDFTELIEEFDRLYIVSDGHIGRTLYKGEFGKATITDYLLTGNRKKTSIKSKLTAIPPMYLRLENVYTKEIHDLTLVVREQEILGVFDVDYSCGEELSKLLIGDRKIISGDFYIGEKKLRRVSCSTMIKHLVGYISCLENAVLFPGLTAQENATVLVWDRTHRLSSIYQERFSRFAYEQIRNYTGVDHYAICKNLDDKKQLLLQLGRWKLYNPKVLIVERPFMNGDVVQAQMIQDYLASKVEEGCASIVISSNINYLKRFCDRIIYMRNGQKFGEYESREFERTS